MRTRGRRRMRLTIQEIAAAVSAKNKTWTQQDIIINSVEFDTRNVKPGSLFVPLKGARDGHDFIDQAFESGAVVTFSDRELDGSRPYLLVEDTLKAMQHLAAYYVKKIGPKVIGITGSNGKTTTKDMTSAVLSTMYQTYKTQGNFNNEIGMPYTMLAMPENTEMLVLEMGMDRKGDIELLSSLARPDVAAITMIGESHIEYLGSRQGIAEAKMEIISGLSPEGLLVVPHSEPLIQPFLPRTGVRIKTFGLDSGSDVLGKVITEEKNKTVFTTTLCSGVSFEIPVLGAYNVSNALIALTIGNHFNVPMSSMTEALAHFDLTKNRTEWLETPDGLSILSDVYNANPTAMTLVLDSFSHLETKGRKIVVLGDMLELGEQSEQMHTSIAPHVKETLIQDVFLYGERMSKLAPILIETFGESRIHAFNKEEQEALMTVLTQTIKRGDTVFLKGSNGMGLQRIVDFLLKNC